MNRMYRRQRHIYDGTRRYYLLGRDGSSPACGPARGQAAEIGCGTGRNLVLAAGYIRRRDFSASMFRLKC